MPNRIRSVVFGDLDRLVSLDQIALREVTRVATIQRGIDAGTCWVADDNSGRPLGYALLNKRAFFGFDFVELLCVKPSARRRGVGRALIEHLERECTTAKLFTSTNESNTAMRELLTRLGYRWSGVIYNLDKNDPEFTFVKLLVATDHRVALPMFKNVMVYLVGFSGSGKLTVAREFSLLLEARVIDNHWINNPIFGLIDNDRVTPFPTGVWNQIGKVRQAVLDTIATLSAPDANFILTHAGYDDDREDWEIYHAIATTAERRKAFFVPVRLLCQEGELARRVVSPERASRLKSIDPARRPVETRGIVMF